MRLISESHNHFCGTHKGATIEIEHETCCDRFYIIVTAKDGGHLYDGWAPKEITTMRDAKNEAVRGARL